MPIVIQYFLKLSIYLALVYLFYQLVLRKLTFYTANRWYLLGYSLLSFWIPFINITPLLQKSELTTNSVVQFIPSFEVYTTAFVNAAGCPVQPVSWDKWDWMALVGITGMILFFVLFFTRLFSFFYMRRKAKLLTNDGVKLYQVDKEIIPFSFGNSVFINRHLHSEEELTEIIRHEFVHIKQKHTADIIWCELLCILNWYNPFVWFIRKAIRQNLEFIADDKVLENGINKKQYQYLLLKVIGNNQFSIASKFNFSSLKKRIAMMNRFKTTKLHLFKFLFVVPLLAVVLLSFRSITRSFSSGEAYSHSVKDTLPAITINPAQMQNQIDEIIAFTIKNPAIALLYSTEDKAKHIVFLNDGTIEKYGYPGTPSPEELEKKYGTLPALYKETQYDYSAYDAEWNHIAEEAAKYFNNTGKKAKTIIFPGDSRVLVQLSNNRVEIYDMDYDKDRSQFEEVFGKLPDCVPPPSRTDDVPAEERSLVINDTTPVPPLPPSPPVPPVPPANINDPGVKAFLKRNPGVKDVGWVYNNENGQVLTVITKKDGTTEQYYLDDPAEKAKAENKYGKLPIAPPPPPPPLPPTPPAKGPDAEPNAAIKTNRSNVSGDFEITNKKAVMHLKNGKTEIYDLTNSAQRKKFEDKYGKIIDVTATVNADAPTIITPITGVTTNFSATSVSAPEVSVKNVGSTFVATPAVTTTVQGATVISPVSAIAGGMEGVTIADDDGNMITGKEEVMITITKKTTPDQLEEYKKQMKEKGIELKFDDTRYEKGILTHISGTVKFKKGSGSFSGSDFNKLILAVFKDGENIYLKVRTTDNKEVI
ncbi:MAG: M56 family metallopeptidase [Bacteroidota bacterium]|nr:M56 family metallopeptidase [Bacteroidota bacterium]